MMSAKLAGFNKTEPSTGFAVIRGLLRWLLGLLFKIEVRGIEKAPPCGYILAANHLGWLDAFLFLAFFPVNPKLYVLADRQSIEKTWWKRWIVGATGRVITIDRSHRHGDSSAMRAALRALGEGHALALFPEGVIGDTEGKVGRLQRGIGSLCLRSGRPVLPVGLSGVSELYLGREITVSIGTPFTPLSNETSVPRKIDDVTGQVQAAMERTLPAYHERFVAHKRMRWLTRLL